MIHLSILLP
jgi:hypothetical protein